MSETPTWPAPPPPQPGPAEPHPGPVRPTFAWVAFALAMVGAIPVLMLGALALLFREVGCSMGQSGCNDTWWLWVLAGVLATVVVPWVAFAVVRSTRTMLVNVVLTATMFVPLLGWTIVVAVN